MTGRAVVRTLLMVVPAMVASVASVAALVVSGIEVTSPLAVLIGGVCGVIWTFVFSRLRMGAAP